MEALIGLVLGGSGELYMWVGGIAAALLGAMGLYFKGGSNAKKKAKIGDLEGALEVGSKADEARKNSSDDDRSGDDRLRDHDRIRD